MFVCKWHVATAGMLLASGRNGKILSHYNTSFALNQSRLFTPFPPFRHFSSSPDSRCQSQAELWSNISKVTWLQDISKSKQCWVWGHCTQVEQYHENLKAMLTAVQCWRPLHPDKLQLSHVNLVHSAAYPNAMSCQISSNAHSTTKQVVFGHKLSLSVKWIAFMDRGL